jgi:hypothetical protein
MPARSIRYLAAIALWTFPILARAQSPSTPSPELLLVTRTVDDGSEGSLRWAIERNNTAPGRFRIEIAPAGQPPHVIKPVSLLPAIKGPVVIEGAAWKRSGEFTVLDGSGYIEDKGSQTCAGAVPGQYGTNVRTTTNPGLALVDTQGVEISGLEIRNFCIGVLIHRSSGNFIHDNRIVGNRGGAGVMLTGDDGNGNATATTTVHNKVQRNDFLDNGDGLELTRGAAFNMVADNVFRSTDANPEPSQGIEILLGNDNTVVSNRFEGYSDGLQINWGHRNYIAANIFTNNTFGLSLSGVGNVMGGDPVQQGLVASLGRPSGNLTGFGWLGFALAAKRLELLRELLPNGTTIGMLVNSANPDSDFEIRDVQDAARTLGRQIHILTASSDGDFDGVFATLVKQQIGALIVASDAYFSGRRGRIVALAARHGVAVIYERREFPDAGGLISYGHHRADAYRQLGIYSGRILKGTKPADLPVLQPTRFELVINLNAAKALGIEISPKLLALADEVIE